MRDGASERQKPSWRAGGASKPDPRVGRALMAFSWHGREGCGGARAWKSGWKYILATVTRPYLTLTRVARRVVFATTTVYFAAHAVRGCAPRKPWRCPPAPGRLRDTLSCALFCLLFCLLFYFAVLLAVLFAVLFASKCALLDDERAVHCVGGAKSRRARRPHAHRRPHALHSPKPFSPGRAAGLLTKASAGLLF